METILSQDFLPLTSGRGRRQGRGGCGGRGGEGGRAAAVERRTRARQEGQEGGGALLVTHLLKHKSHGPLAT